MGPLPPTTMLSPLTLLTGMDPEACPPRLFHVTFPQGHTSTGLLALLLTRLAWTSSAPLHPYLQALEATLRPLLHAAVACRLKCMKAFFDYALNHRLFVAENGGKHRFFHSPGHRHFPQGAGVSCAGAGPR